MARYLSLTSGLKGYEMFCINRRCQQFMIEMTTGERVDDPRYDVADLPDSDPRKFHRIKQLLNSSDFVEQIAAIRILEFVEGPELVDILNEYLVEGKLKDSLIEMAVSVLLNDGNVKGLPGIQAGVRRLELITEDPETRDEYDVSLFVQKASEYIDRLKAPCKNLIEATKKNDIDAVKEFLKNGADPNEKGQRDSTPLHWAVSKNRKKIVEVLITGGADSNLKDADGITSLSLALNLGFNKIEEVLRKAGSGIDYTQHGHKLSFLKSILHVFTRK